MVPVGVVDEGAKAVGGVMVTAMPAVGTNPGEGFHVVADACCDSGEIRRRRAGCSRTSGPI